MIKSQSTNRPKGTIVPMFTRLSALVGLSALLLLLAGCGEKKTVEEATPDRDVTATVTKEGTGPVIKEGDALWVLYRGTYKSVDEDGHEKVTPFDTNMDDVTAQMPFMFEAGPRGQVIEGWRTGLIGVKGGSEVTLNIPWEKAYGPNGDGGKIPAKQDLDFDIQVLYVFREEFKEVFDIENDVPGTGAEIKEGDSVSIHYRGTYLTGKRWDDTRERGKPVTLKVGEKKAMIGLEYGLIGMKAGGMRTIVVPFTLAFGPSGTKWVQGMQPLRLEIEVLKVN